MNGLHDRLSKIENDVKAILRKLKDAYDRNEKLSQENIKLKKTIEKITQKTEAETTNEGVLPNIDISMIKNELDKCIDEVDQAILKLGGDRK